MRSAGCYSEHRHIRPKELLESPELAGQMCPKTFREVLIALTTATASLAARQPPEPMVSAAGPREHTGNLTIVQSDGSSPPRTSSPGADGGVSKNQLLRAAEVRKRTGLSRTTIWRMQRTDSFPKSVSLGTRAVGWREAEIEAWLASRA